MSDTLLNTHVLTQIPQIPNVFFCRYHNNKIARYVNKTLLGLSLIKIQLIFLNKKKCLDNIFAANKLKLCIIKLKICIQAVYVCMKTFYIIGLPLNKLHYLIEMNFYL